MNELLCASPRCKPPTRHKPDCVQDPQEPCRGCLPARAADGLRLCQYETDRLAVHPVEAATLWIELGLALVGSGVGVGIGQKNPGRGLNLNLRVVEHRATIRHVLVAVAKRIADERGFNLPADSVHAIAAFVARNHQWLAAHEEAGQFADELAGLIEVGRSLRQPSSTRIIEIGPCPRTVDSDDGDEQTPCPGVLRALLRSEASLLPSAVQCDTSEDHCWDSTQWTKLGRHIPKKEKTLTSMPEPKTLQGRVVAELRAAVEKIRDHLEGLAHQGTDTPTWFYERNPDADAYPWTVSARPLNDEGKPYDIHIATGVTPQVAQYIALWHPGIAKLVAAWLECVAIGEDDGLLDSPSRARETSTALMIARAINSAAAAKTEGRIAA